MKKILRMFKALAASSLLVGVLAMGNVAYAATPVDSGSSGSAQSNVCKGIGLTTANGQCGDNGTQLRSAISAAINILSLAVGIAAVVMLIVAGFKFITSSGDTGKIANAKGSVIYAIIGIIVVALAQFVVKFVLTQVKA